MHIDDNDLDLTGAAASFDIPAGDVDTVLTRARKRSRRQRAGLATVTTIAVVAGAVAFIGTRGDRDGRIGVATQPGGVARLGDAGLRWTRADNVEGLAWSPSISGDGPVYALSTGKGEKAVEGTRQNGYVYRSTDGVDWTSASKLGTDLYLSDLAPGSGRVYAVGTGPATAMTANRKPASDVLAGWSDDDGKTWSKAHLPVDVIGMAPHTLTLSVVDTAIATSDKGTVAVAQLQAALDVPALLPAGAAAPNGWATTATGVDVLGPKRDNPCPAGTSLDNGGEPATKPDEVMPTYCMKPGTDGRDPTVLSPQDARGVTASYTWDQLHVDGDLLRAARHQPFAFFAPAGSTQFERVQMADASISAPITLEHDAAGFDLVAAQWVDPVVAKQARPGMTVLHSPDGRQWEQAPPQDGLDWFGGAGQLGGRAALLGGGTDGAFLLRKTDTGWGRTPLDDLVPHAPNTQFNLGSGGVGPAGVAVVLMETPDDATMRANPQQRWQPTYHLLTSRDGVTWQAQSLEDVAGQPVTGVSGIVVTADRIVVTFLQTRTDASAATAPRITMVGTPR
ncbi:MAG: hypothetical protein QOE35_1631 [Actinomycetota bacterium]|jgi:hypothetical protein